MVERARRGKAKRRLADNHQRSWLWGRHVVVETLRAGRWPVEQLLLSDQLAADELDLACAAARARHVHFDVVPPDRLKQLAGSSEHQGHLARMGPFPYVPIVSLRPRDGERPLFVLLDGIEDPHNFGAIVRSAEVLGVDGIVIAEHGQVGVTTHVARASAGAVNHVPIARVENLVAAARTLAGWGVTSIGASEAAEETIAAVDLTGACAIAIGNEGRGLSAELREACGRIARIPQVGRVGSLNAAVAAGILFYEARRQRDARGTP